MQDRPGVTTTLEIAAPPEHVLAWLVHAPAFPLWVVGPGRVVEVDDQWPAPGSAFTHETGRGPVRFHDRTVMEDLDRATGRVALRAMVRPAGLALVQLHVTESAGGSRLVMHERPLGGLAAGLPEPIYAPALRLRNAFAVRRLRRLVEGGPPPAAPDGD